MINLVKVIWFFRKAVESYLMLAKTFGQKVVLTWTEANYTHVCLSYVTFNKLRYKRYLQYK